MFASSGDGRKLSPEEVRGLQQRHNPPENEVPGVVPFAAVIGRSDSVAVAITGLFAYSSGLSLQLAVRLRRPDRATRPVLHEQLHGGRFGRAAEGALLLGVAYPDGRTASNVDVNPMLSRDTSPDRPSLQPGGGGGGDTSYDIRYWLTPLPGPGDLTIVSAWPSRDLAEVRTVVGADLIAAGVAGIVELWPWEPAPDPAAAEPPPPLELPPGSWFAS